MRAALDVYGSPRLPPETRHNTGLLLLGDSKHPPLRGEYISGLSMYLMWPKENTTEQLTMWSR